MVDGFVWVDGGCWRSEVLFLEIARCGSLAGYYIRFSLILQDAVALKVRYRVTKGYLKDEVYCIFSPYPKRKVN